MFKRTRNEVLFGDISLKEFKKEAVAFEETRKETEDMERLAQLEVQMHDLEKQARALRNEYWRLRGEGNKAEARTYHEKILNVTQLVYLIKRTKEDLTW